MKKKSEKWPLGAKTAPAAQTARFFYAAAAAETETAAAAAETGSLGIDIFGRSRRQGDD